MTKIVDGIHMAFDYHLSISMLFIACN